MLQQCVVCCIKLCWYSLLFCREAEATRNALCGVQWPIGNGKQLQIDYATIEDLRKAQNPSPQPLPVQQEQVVNKQSLENEVLIG